jgi:hypothetical protein
MPEIVRLEKHPEGRPKPSLEESGIGATPAAFSGTNLSACHILPHTITKFAKLSWQTPYEMGKGVDTPVPQIIGKGSPLPCE